MCCYLQLIGGVEGDRTLDLRIANAALSQLSYHPGEGGGFYRRFRAAGMRHGTGRLPPLLTRPIFCIGSMVGLLDHHRLREDERPRATSRRRRRPVAKRTAGSHLVVFAPPALDPDARFLQIRLTRSLPTRQPPSLGLRSGPGSLNNFPRFIWWAGLDSNQGPRDYESPALTG